MEYSRRSVGFAILGLILTSVFLGCSEKAVVKHSDNQRYQTSHSSLLDPGSKRVLDRSKNQLGAAASDANEAYHSRYKNIWQRIMSLYQLPRHFNPRIQKEMQWYLKNPDYFDRVQLRAEPYLFEIVDQFEKQGIPGEFALLPVVESAFQPYAYSPARASGIWQFIPSTGRIYGLKQNWWVDERRDIYAATQAAIRYFHKLSRDFNGDWLLVLAAYNCGEGKVQSAINRNIRRRRGTDFWSLKLPRETRAYVPRLLAVSRLLEDADVYGIRLRSIPDQPYFKKFTIASQIDLKRAAELAGISMSKLYHLNPGYNQWASPPFGPHRLLLPLENAEIFSDKIDQLSKQRIQWRRHRIQRGDSLQSIANRYGTSVENLLKSNRITKNHLAPGTYLIVPLSDEQLAHYSYFPNPYAPKQRPKSRKSRKSKKRIVYRVRRGDTLSKIAKRYGVRVKSLAKWNRLRTRSVIRPGQRLAIYSRGSYSKRSRRAKFRRYTVRKGDSLARIARRFNVTVADLRRWNRPKLGKYLIPGQKIKVRRRPTS